MLPEKILLAICLLFTGIVLTLDQFGFLLLSAIEKNIAVLCLVVVTVLMLKWCRLFPHLERFWWLIEGWLETTINRHRWAWLLSGIAMAVIALGFSSARFWLCDPPHHTLDSALEIVSFILALLITLGGFILAILALRQIIDRPLSLEEVLYKATDMIKNRIDDETSSGDKDYFLSIYTEYPVNGAMSLQGNNTYDKYYKILLSCTNHDSPFYLEIIVPPDWPDKIKKYQTIYGFNEKIYADAVKHNRNFLKRTESCRDVPQKPDANKEIFCSVKETTNGDFPKYQAIIIGEHKHDRAQGKRILSPKEGIIFFALESIQPKAPNRSHDVNILAWKTHDANILNDVIIFFNSLALEEMDELPELKEEMVRC